MTGTPQNRSSRITELIPMKPTDRNNRSHFRVVRLEKAPRAQINALEHCWATVTAVRRDPLAGAWKPAGVALGDS
jgi:hypothetical protein